MKASQGGIQTMVTPKRWQQAQTYERSYWANLAEKIASGSAGQLGWYAWKAAEMRKRLVIALNRDLESRSKILEIGSGPIGIVSFLDCGERYTIDPLEEYYCSSPTLSALRTAGVVYGSGSGERLPFAEGFFSHVILDNVLDHVHQADAVLREIHRVLSSDGIFYLAVNIHLPWGAFLHKILSRLKIDRGHPYTFTDVTIRRFVESHGFHVKQEFINDYEKSKKQDLTSQSLKDRLKGHSGLSEFVYHAVCQKRPSVSP